jgi:hypothetical protein
MRTGGASQIEARQADHYNFPLAVEDVRFMSAFGTSETAYATLMLRGLIEATCDGSSPSEQDLNQCWRR